MFSTMELCDWRDCIKELERRTWSSKVDFKVRVISIFSKRCSKGCKKDCFCSDANEVVVGVFGGIVAAAAVLGVDTGGTPLGVWSLVDLADIGP